MNESIQLDCHWQERLKLTPEQLAEFCQRRQVIELALFGSVLRDDFDQDSDIDLLVTFELGAPVSLLDVVDMQYELEALCDRSIDILTRKSVETSPNWMRRQAILNNAQIIYES
ncbi:nucleotidyltransferase domain-containing protein [Spirulina sp. CCNP1310]|uniref:nucleotidyltransferase family protein n=1 Tax=Spirulina sp. CCNP1310 TaxID=3110249 RepID=UPI002B1F7D82|nr:nucleotidyltransferase domain-containing protein [Spirulina sp. CCNP1310]MEA5421287.1 nucleotidyltransferase domain-containing protein [Spirulina sp. CCNP1310]